MGAGDILLGEGVFTLQPTTAAGTAIALTRGGGEFSLEREIRQVEADGDFGPVKGRVRKTRVVPKLTVRALEMLNTNMTKFYPGTKYATTTRIWSGSTDIGSIADADFLHAVTFTGKTKDGREVVIKVENAINLEEENIWELIDKEEVVPEITFSGAYPEHSTAVLSEPWSVTWAATAT